jgi:hypothetical protein
MPGMANDDAETLCSAIGCSYFAAHSGNVGFRPFYGNFFSIIAQIRIFYVENFGLMATGEPA